MSRTSYSPNTRARSNSGGGFKRDNIQLGAHYPPEPRRSQRDAERPRDQSDYIYVCYVFMKDSAVERRSASHQTGGLEKF